MIRSHIYKEVTPVNFNIILLVCTYFDNSKVGILLPRVPDVGQYSIGYLGLIHE
jgi:hypothetical protein